MNNKVLIVDDEPNVLQSIKRNLRKQFDLETAGGGQEALQLLRSSGPYAVIVSDMKMPGMNGVEFLSEAKRRAPESVRMMLTGNADQQTAVDAVNQGDVFRFLNKPCDSETLAEAVTAALNHHRLIVAERDLLENTLRGSIRALSEVLSLTNPEVFGRTTRIKNYVSKLAMQLGISHLWRLETAALLSQIGCVTVDEELVKKRAVGEAMTPAELREFQLHTGVGAQLLSSIPRMEAIADCILFQEKNYDGSGFPEDDRSGDDIPLGARLLKIVIDFDAQESRAGKVKALAHLKKHANLYDPEMLDAFEVVLEGESTVEAVEMRLSDLADGMILAADVFTNNEVMLVSKGQETTSSVRRYLRDFYAKKLIGDSVVVLYDQQ